MGSKEKGSYLAYIFCNGFKFHTKELSIGKQTVNYGVCVKGECRNRRNRVLTVSIVEMKKLIIMVSLGDCATNYGEPRKQLALFNCQWFDIERNHGVKKFTRNMILWRFIIVKDI